MNTIYSVLQKYIFEISIVVFVTGLIISFIIVRRIVNKWLESQKEHRSQGVFLMQVFDLNF